MTIIILLAAGALLVLSGAYVTYHIAFHSSARGQSDLRALPPGEQYAQNRERMLELIDQLEVLPFEQVYITSHDGLRLAARYYHSADGAPLDIELHGYRSMAVRDFCGGTQLALSTGHNVLLVDQRCCGSSGGHTITFGAEERYDCLDWIRYASERFGDKTPILIYGVSMGASTALMVSGMEELPGNVRGVAADSAYTSAREIICKVCRDRRVPPGAAYPLIRLGARLFGGFDPDAADALEAVKKSRTPTLIIHGEDDRFVPCSMGRTLYAECSAQKRLLTVPDAGHCLGYIKAPESYTAALAGWLEDALSR